jgi:hypothetical protein
LCRAGSGQIRPGGTPTTGSKAYRLLERLSQAGKLFTYLRTEFAGLQIASTTNRIQGGTNAQLRLLVAAAGPPGHERTAPQTRDRVVPLPPQRTAPATGQLIKAEHYRRANTEAVPTIEQEPGPQLYSTGLSADEDLWQRKGWAGRT